MTAEQIKQIENEINLLATGAAPFVSLLGPQAVAGLIIGRAVASQAPQLVAIVERWVKGIPPTPEERQLMLDELAVLSDPNLP